MLEALDSHRPWRTSFNGWLYRIAHNLLSDHLRTGERWRNVPLGTLAESGATVTETVDLELTLDSVRHALNRLKPDYAEVLLLRFGEGLTHAEVAVQLGKSEAAIKVIQHRALRALRARLTGAERTQ